MSRWEMPLNTPYPISFTQHGVAIDTVISEVKIGRIADDGSGSRITARTVEFPVHEVELWTGIEAETKLAEGFTRAEALVRANEVISALTST